jgi:DNA adenine methylase
VSDEFSLDLLEVHHQTYKPDKADRTKIVRAPFRMAGSKYFSLKELLPRLPVKAKWCDHFGGTGIVTLNRPKSYKLEVFNDRYSGVIAFYRCLKDKDKWKEMLAWLSNTLYSREEFQWCRDTWVTEHDDVIRAAKWLYCTANSVVGKRVAWARATDSQAATAMAFQSMLEFFPKYHERFKNVQIENLDYDQCARDYDSLDTVHYFDPPYVNTDQQLYEGSSWTRDDQRRLVGLIGNLQGFCALSGYYDEETDKAIKWDYRHSWKVAMKSEIDDEGKSQDGFKGEQITEYLWIKT